MIEVQYMIEFFSPWHCGSGMGGGNDADYCPVQDADGFPFVPGKTLKGLFRDASQNLYGTEFTVKIFGESGEDLQYGKAVWTNAELKSGTKAKIKAEENTTDLIIGRYFTAIDNNGQTVDTAFRRGEYALPVKLYGTIRNLEEADVPKIKACMGFIKHLGLQRSRGFGRCRISALQSKTCESITPPPARKQSNEYYFKCRFLSPVILNTTGATEGAIDTLEYIPGSNFLGIAAKDYHSFCEKAFDVFHSGKVRFGNAYPLENGNSLAMPCPATWFVQKGKSISDTQETIFWNYGKRAENQAKCQPRQVRGGYFIPDKQSRNFSGDIFKTFSLKSAYDSEKRKSKDSSMFGYTALNQGTEWGFSLKIDSSVDHETVSKIIAGLLGTRQIGRSKNSQYGSVEISMLENSPLKGIKQQENALYYLYCCSPAAFLDEYGEPAILPQMKDIGFSDNAKFDMQETQVRYQMYCPWNAARRSRDAERLIVLPGSVFAVSSPEPPDMSLLEKGAGLFLSEGFGELLCNPRFLFTDKLEKAEEQKQTSSNGNEYDKLLCGYLKRKKTERENIRYIYNNVKEMLDDKQVRKISASQWGAIRAIAAEAEDYQTLDKALFEKAPESADTTYTDKIKNNGKSHVNHPGFLCHGTAAKQWKNGLAEELRKMISAVDEKYKGNYAKLFTLLLCAEMAKKSSQGGKKI